MATITRDMLNIPADMLRDVPLTIAQLRQQQQQQLEFPINNEQLFNNNPGPIPAKTLNPKGEADRVCKRGRQARQMIEDLTDEEADRRRYRELLARELSEQEALQVAALRAEENRRIEKVRKLAGLVDKVDKERSERFSGNSGFVDAGFPPRVYPWSEGYDEYVDVCKKSSGRRNEHILHDHPEYKLEEPYTIEIDIDTPATDGFIQQLEDHVKVWAEPCLIRLADILKQSPEYREHFPEFTHYVQATLRERVACRRHYALPHTHSDGPDCNCIFCRACIQTLRVLPQMGINAETLATGMIDKIRQRTVNVMIAQIKMSFQEEAEVALDERICYGFRSALPPLVFLHFEEFFTEIYSIGADMCWEIIKRLAILIKYTPDYASALHFLTFWVDVCERVERVVRRLENDMDCFNWKLKECNMDLRMLFFHFITVLIHDLEEFQDVFKQCKRVVALQRMYHPCRENEIDNNYLLVGLDRIETMVSDARVCWNERTLPFDLFEYDVPKYNVFKISRLRNPYIRLESNTMEAYEVVQCSVTGTLEMRKLENEAMCEIDFAEPILDCNMRVPRYTDRSYHIRMFRREICLTPAETDQFVKSGDISFLRTHGANIAVKSGGKEYMEDYIQHREISDLDKVEGRLPMEVEDILFAESRQAARDDFRYKRRLLNAKERERSMKASQSLKWPPAYPIYGHKTRQRSMLRSFRTILQRTFWKPKVLKYCRKGIKCERYERSGISRYRYAFGGLPVQNRDPRSALMEGQKYDLSSEILSYAMQLGTGNLDPLATNDDDRVYKYFVMYKIADKKTLTPKPKFSTEHNPELYSTLCRAIDFHYSCLAQYDLITVEESLSSPHLLQREWAQRVELKADDIAKENFNTRLDALKKDSPKTSSAVTKVAHLRSAKKTVCDDIGVGRKCTNTPNTPSTPMPPLVDISRRKVAVAAATTTNGDNEEEHLVAISEDGQILAFGTRVTPPPPEPKARNCKPTTKDKSGNNWKTTVAACRCPHGHSHGPHEATMSHSLTFDGTLHVEATLDMGANICTHHHSHETPHTHKHTTNPPPANRNAPAASGGNAKPGPKSEQRPSRPGLPVSVGYAEKRNNLRQKLERANSKKKKDTIIFTTSSPPTDDLDELVNIIEGNASNGASNSRKGSVSSDTVDPKKAAKKARKKERKEQLRLEEENQRLAEEERLRKEAEELLRKEEEEREEQARKRREKKKKQKQKKKDNNMSQSYADLVTCVLEGQKPAEKDTKKKKDDEKKRNEEEKTKKEKEADRRTAAIPPQIPTAVVDNSTKGRTPTLTTDDNPIVTIRRHSNTPDANVTISVKGDNGEEDVLYTLVNGKVLRSDASASSKEVASSAPSAEVGKKKKKKSKGAESGGNSLLNTTIPEDTRMIKINQNLEGLENGSMHVMKNRMTYDVDDKAMAEALGRHNRPQATSRKPVVDSRSSRGEEIDVENLNIPSGLTITRLNQPLSSYPHPNTVQSKSWEGLSLTKLETHNQGYPNVSHGASDGYEHQQNRFLGNQNYGMGEDCPTFGQQPIIFPGKELGPGEFEEVVSNKKRRLRNKANKLKDGEEEPEGPAQTRGSNGSLEFKMMDLSINPSTTNTNQYHASNSKRYTEEGVPSSPTISAEMGRRKRLVQKADGRGAQGTSQRNLNGISPKGNSNRSASQGKDSGTNAEFQQPSFEHHNSRAGKPARVPVNLGGGTMPRLTRQANNPNYQARPWPPQQNNAVTTQEDMTQKPGILGNSWQAQQSRPNNEQPTLFDTSVRRLNDMGYVQSQTQPSHFEKSEPTPQHNGGWHPMSTFNTDSRPLSFQQPEMNPYQPNLVPHFHSGEQMFSNYQKMQQCPKEQQQQHHHQHQHQHQQHHHQQQQQHLHHQHQQQHQHQHQHQPQLQQQHQSAFQFTSPAPNIYQQNIQYPPEHEAIFAEYHKMQDPNFEPAFNSSVDSSSYHRMTSGSPFSPQIQPQTNPQQKQQQQQPFSSALPWGKPTTPNAPGSTFAQVLKRFENDSKEDAFGFGPFAQAERMTGSPWGQWGGEGDRSEAGSGAGGAIPSPELFHQNNTVGSGVQRTHYMEENNTNSRAPSCDPTVVGGSRSPFPITTQTPIRRPTPASSPFAFGNPPVDPSPARTTLTGSPCPPVQPEWGFPAPKLGTFWNSHT